MGNGTVCLVTIHGIGFQQAPDGSNPGYADTLHQRLCRYLDAATLSDDPRRERTARGQAGPIYVQSSWPPDSANTEAGLRRLGTWQQSNVRAVDGTDAPLVQPGARVAHVALVYSHLQDVAPRPGSVVETALKAGISLGHYTTVSGLVRTAFTDIAGLVHAPGASEDADAPTSLRTRLDTPPTRPHALTRIFGRASTDAPGAASGPLATLRALEDDVAAYVCRNDLRERVRGFVRDAIHRLCYRSDVETVIVNAHSNGTVIAFDVLRELTPVAAAKVRWFVTAGSPLRKYTDLFYWGTEVGSIRDMGNPRGWSNFWDARDPVADPLGPPSDWLRGQDLPAPGPGASLYLQVSETGTVSSFAIEDVEVDNLHYSVGGGLQAHNYWDNQEQVVRPLADIIVRAAE